MQLPTVRSAGTLEFDPMEPAVSANPYPWYARLRREAPVYFVAPHDFWVMTRYDDVRDALRDTRTFSSAFRGFKFSPHTASMISSDPPEHTRLRRIANHLFTPRAISRWEDKIRDIAESLFTDLASANSSGAADVMTQFAAPLPSLTIAAILGVSAADHARFTKMAEEALGYGSFDPESQRQALIALRDLSHYFERSIEEKRRHPGDDLISLLVAAGANEDEPLTHQEILHHCKLFLVAGVDTTANLMGNAVINLARRPKDLRRVKKDPSLIPQTIEEVLRFEGPTLGMFREVTCTTEVAGVTLPEGAMVQLLFASANRDERHFSSPDTFDIDRNPRDHVGFAGGPHLCLGAHLARLEVRLFLELLLTRTEQLRLRGTPVLVPHLLTHGHRSIPVAFEPERAA